MIEQRFKEIIDKLISSTKQKKIKWEVTERETEFKVVLGSSMVTTDNWLLETGVMCVDLTLWNSNKEVAGRIAFENDEKEEKDYEELLVLYTLAKNSYYLVDETFAEILNKLDFEE